MSSTDSFSERVEAACEKACASIAPTWPLDQSIAVNPHWNRIGLPVREVAARMAVLGQIQVFPSRPYLASAWKRGRIARADLQQALQALPEAKASGLTPEHCIDALNTPYPKRPKLPLLIDKLDDDPKRYGRLSWRDAITYQVSQTCAAYFDEFQADWQPERKSHGLYEFWRYTLTHDHGIGLLMGLPELGKSVSALPKSRQEAERWVLQRLALSPSVWADYLESVLLTVNGWASWCAYLNWQAQLAGGSDTHLRDLLAIRLAWGAILLDCKHDDAAVQAFKAVQTSWAQAPALLEQAKADLLIDEVWQLALESGYQAQLAAQLRLDSVQPKPPISKLTQALSVQAAFCIDVRSEPIRRALEQQGESVQTLGFAGFFGLPAAYTPAGTLATRSQMPGLLQPSVQVTDCIVPSTNTAVGTEAQQAALQTEFVRSRLVRLGASAQWDGSSRWPATAFSYVEAAGLAYLSKLSSWIKPKTAVRQSDDDLGIAKRYRPICRPSILAMSESAKVSLAASVLTGMGLTKQFAKWVVLAGHGSHTSNNPHAASLDCGACCGQTGEVNARVLAQLLNETPVRSGLAKQGIVVPEDTQFVAALHNTTTDEFEWFDQDLLPGNHQAEVAALEALFEQACRQVRQERAFKLGLDSSQPHALFDALRRRANDGAETRPEWGLAGNAAFVIAPRQRTAHLSLNGRVFLHDYDAAADPDSSLLELLMTAPMLVTHWINWQYHASTCEPQRFGSGNKLLHNVVGGHLGVFEGNGGDLRIGLSEQSVHNGEAFVHEPVRLTVVIDAPAESIERIVQSHTAVRQLIDNGWLHLWRLDGKSLTQYHAGQWRPIQHHESASELAEKGEHSG